MSVKYHKFNGNENTPLNSNTVSHCETKGYEQSSGNNIEIGSESVVRTEAVAENKGFVFTKASRKGKLLLIMCASAYFLSSCACSLLMSFYPLIAEKKGVKQTMIGFIFSVYQLNVFIVSIIIGNYLTKIGTRFVFITGIFVGGVASILFGVLDKGPDGTIFAVMCILCRSVEAIGYAAFITACMTIISNEFPEHVGTVFAILEVGSGFGFMIGPVIGGVLYELGGYGLPFYITGSLITINGIAIYVLLPATKDSEPVAKGAKSTLHFLKHPLAIFALTSLFVGAAGTFVLDSTFAKHMEPFNLSAAEVGLLFTIGPALYALTAPLLGYLTDMKDCLLQLIVTGYILFSAGYLFCGPSPLLPFIQFELWVVIVGLIMLGVAIACMYIPTMKGLVTTAYLLGYPKSEATFGMTSGFFNSAVALGGFVGPFAGSAIVETFGYPTGYTVIALLGTLSMSVLMGFHVFRYFTKTKVFCDRNGTNEIGKCDDEKKNIVSNIDDNDDDIITCGESRRTSFTASLVSGIPALSLSTTVSELSVAGATNRDYKTINTKANGT